MNKRKVVTEQEEGDAVLKSVKRLPCSKHECKACIATLPSLWRKGTHPDSNIGKTEVGPSREKITHASAIALLDRLGVDEQSIFVDIGCGHGLVCAAAALHSSCKKSMGIDLANDLISWALYDCPRVGNLFYYTGDLCTPWPQSLDDATHYYCNNREFPPRVLSAMAHKLYYNRMVWERFASAKSITQILRALRECGVREDHEVYRFWGMRVTYEPVSVGTSLAVTLCGSRQRIGIYIMINA